MATQKPTAAFLWEGFGMYPSAPTNLLTTELNSLANSNGNTLSVLGQPFENISTRVYADIEFGGSVAFSPVAGGFVEVWLLRSFDPAVPDPFSSAFSVDFGAGTNNTEDGFATIAPGRRADAIIGIRAGTSVIPRGSITGIVLPPSYYYPIARNQTGTTLPSSGNFVRYVGYSMGR